MSGAQPYTDYIEPPPRMPGPSDTFGLAPRAPAPTSIPAPTAPDQPSKPPDQVLPAGDGQLPPVQQISASDNQRRASDYVSRIMQLEGDSKDPRSSAVGGFLDNTWLSLLQKYMPEAASLPPEQLLAARSDPVLRGRMVAAYASDNAGVLKQAGIEPNETNLRLSHWFGPQGAIRVLSASAETPISQIFSPEVVAANPVLAGKTAGDVLSLTKQQMQGQSLRQWATAPSEALQERARALETEADTLRDRYHADANELMRQANAAPAGSKERDEAIASLREKEHLYLSKYEELSSHPPVKKPVDALENFGSAATIVALLGGLFARRHLTAALGAAGQAMQAINQNNHEEFQRSYKTWEQQTTTALNMVKLHNEEIRSLIDDKKTAWDEKNARLRLLFEGLGMQRQADQLALGAHEKVFQEFGGLEKAAQSAAQSKLAFQTTVAAQLEAKYLADGVPAEEAKVRAYREAGLVPSGAAQTPGKAREQEMSQEVSRRDAAWAKEHADATAEQKQAQHFEHRKTVEQEMAIATAKSGTGELSDEQVKFLAKQYVMGNYAVITQLPRSGTARIKVENEIGKMVSEMPEAAQTVALNKLRMVEAESAARTAGRVTMQTELYAKDAQLAGAELIGRSEEYARTEYPKVNAALRAFDTNTGDPKIIRFGNAMNQLLNAYGKMSNPTGTGVHDADKERFTKIMDTALSKGQIREGVDQVIREARLMSSAAEQAQREVLTRLVPGSNIEPLAPPPVQLPSSPVGGGIPRIDNQAAYDALPSGAHFTAPDGKEWIKP